MQMLNSAQKKAVMTLEGPVIVIAGAGTGKTRVLEYRTLELVKHGVEPRSILLLTFTRRAATEMLDRASRHDHRCKDVSGGTFHSFALEMLKRYGKSIGFNSFTVLDRADNEDVIAKVVSDLRLREKKYFPKKRTIAGILSKASNKDVLVQKIVEDEYPHLFEWKEAIELIRTRYKAYKNERQLLDFDDLLLELYRLLTKFEDIRTKIQRRYQFIMVDEFQDTNKLQDKIVHELAQEHKNILIVGDEMQSIYKFRGAEFANMISFPKQFDNIRQITLETNYRSTREILNIANEILDQVEGDSFKKYLYSDRHGTLPKYIQFKSQQQEAQWIGEQILKLVRQGVKLKNIAVLTRSSYQTAPLEIELSSLSIPFKKYGGIRFIETAHIKDVTAHLKIVTNPKDEIAWRRALLLLDRVGDKTIDSFLKTVRADTRLQGEFLQAQIPKAYNLATMLKQIADKTLSPAQKIIYIIEYYKPFLRVKFDDFSQREQDLEALVEIAGQYEDDEQLLNDMAIDPPNQSAVNSRTDDGDHLAISTIHSAKGLEWHSVFVLQLQDGKFPIVRENTKDEDIEEERRLFYVAVTRAKEKLYLTSSHGRPKGMYESWCTARVSRFVDPLLQGDILETQMLKSTNPFITKTSNKFRSYHDEFEERDIDLF